MLSRQIAVIFDGYDTLWKSQELYAAATSQFHQLLEGMGFDASRVRSLFRSYNRPVPGKGQRPKDRRNRAMTETHATLCRERGRAFDRQVVKELLKTNERIYAVDPRPMENAPGVLSRLAEGAKLVLFSGVDDEVQRRKLAKASLASYFDDRIYVVPQKSKGALRHVLKEEGLDLGLRCIWPYAPPKGQEREPSLSKVYVAFSTGRVGEILSSHSKEGASVDVLWRVRASEREREPEVYD